MKVFTTADCKSLQLYKTSC